jgi:hypothetical protein
MSDRIPEIPDGEVLIIEREGVFRGYRIAVEKYGTGYRAETSMRHPMLGATTYPWSHIATEHLAALIERHGYRRHPR